MVEQQPQKNEAARCSVLATGPREFIVACCMLVILFCVINLGTETPFIVTDPTGPVVEMIGVAGDMSRAQPLSASRFYELQSHLLSLSSQTSQAIWQDVFAVGTHERLLPKHSLLVSAVMVPFMWFFGDYGPAASSLVILLLLFASFFCLWQSLDPKVTSFQALLGFLLGTQVVFYFMPVPYELLDALLVVGPLALVSKRPLVAMAVAPLACLVRPTLLLWLPWTLCFKTKSSQWSLRSRFVGLIIGSVVVAALNYSLWGSTIEFAHHHMPMYVGGTQVMNEGPSQFSIGTLFSQNGHKLFGERGGILLYNPFMVLLVGAFFIRPVRRRLLGIWPLVFGTITQILVIMAYSGWEVTTYGSRYLLAAVLVGAVAVGACLRDVRTSDTTPGHKEPL